MKFVKSIAIGSLLLGLMGTAYAEGGFERTKQFNENFRTEQARLWLKSKRKKARMVRNKPTINRRLNRTSNDERNRQKSQGKTWLFCAWNLAFVLARRFRIAFSGQTLGTLCGAFPMAQQELAGVRFGDRCAS